MFTALLRQSRSPSSLAVLCAACTAILGCATALAGSPRTINVALDVDNYASVFSGDYTASALTPRTFVPFAGPGAGTLNGTFTTTDDYLYIAAWSDNDVQQGLLVQVKIDGQIILTDSGLWEVCATGEDLGFGSPQPTLANMTSKIGIANAGGGPSLGWKTPSLGGINNFTFPVGNPWAPVSLVSTICRWMWYDNGMQPDICCDHQPPFRRGWNHDEFLIFRLRLGCVTPPSDMVAWYPFDECVNPTTAFEFANGFHGQKINSPASVGGKVGPAIELIQSGGVQRHVRVPHAPELNLAANGNDFAIDCWVYCLGASGNPQFIVYKSSPPASGGGWTLFLEFNLRPTIWLDLPNSTVVTVSSTSQVAVNGWTHIAVNVPAVNTGGSFAQFFINGVPETPQAFPRPLTCASTTDLFMGSYDGSTVNGLYARLDEVELFHRNLTAAEVLALYQAGAQGKCKNDCNHNGRSDEYDIANGAPDTDDNGIPDECDCHTCQGDANGDGVVNFLDITSVLANWLTVCP